MALIDPTPIISLHKYWIYANRMRLLFLDVVKNYKEQPGAEPANEVESFVTNHILLTGDYGCYRAYWYGALYVVIEGYKDSKMINTVIENLLAEKDKESQELNVNILRWFRNSTFHFQKEVYPLKASFIDKTDRFVSWTHEIHRELERAIVKEAVSRFPKETVETMLDDETHIGSDYLKRFLKQK